MRNGIFILCGLYAMAFVAIWIGTATASGMDNMSRGMSFGFLIAGVAITAVFAVPALILALMDRALPWALGLALAPVLLLLVTGGF
jgi:hypothetical protein